jgi:hypothetical protein
MKDILGDMYGSYLSQLITEDKSKKVWINFKIYFSLKKQKEDKMFLFSENKFYDIITKEIIKIKRFGIPFVVFRLQYRNSKY